MLTTPAGGRVAVDDRLLAVWRAADGRLPDEVLALQPVPGAAPDEVRAALACLAEAGLLERVGVPVAAPSAPCAASGVPGAVSAIVVSHNAMSWLEICLPSLAAQTYPALEVIVVDNASTDGLRDWLARNHPAFKCVHTEQLVSLSAALNRGAEAASGRYLLLLNADIRLAPAAVAELVAVAEAQPKCAAVAAMLRFTWAEAFINGLGNYVRDHSWGADIAYGHLDLGQFDRWRQVPSVCFAATLIPRDAWDAVGPADEAFPLYYEDAEWSYRARLLGYEIAAAPRAVIYHAFGSSVPTGAAASLTPLKLRRAVFGRLRFTLKTLTGSTLRRFLRNYLAEDRSNLLRAAGRRDWGEVRAYLGAWLAALLSLPRLYGRRRALLRRRQIPDAQLFAQQGAWPAPFDHNGLPRLDWRAVAGHYLPLMHTGQARPLPEFEVPPRPARRPHLLIASNDVVATRMAGPGMRYLEMARALAADCDVTLAVPGETDFTEPGLRLVRYDERRPHSLPVLARNADVALVSGYMVEKFPDLSMLDTRLVVDLYDPFMLENLHYYVREPLAVQEGANTHAISIVNRLARLGDFFICGSERQRDLWMGVLAANGRVNPRTFAQDATLRQLIDVVSLGFPDRPLHAGRHLRGVHPAFPPESRIVLWGGGMWDWLDPLSLLRAWPAVLGRHPYARLVYLGTRHPNPDVPSHAVVGECLRLAEALGEKDRSVFFIEWLPYAEREALLSEADVGVVLHPVHVETRYSIRTRVFDYFWAGLPVLVTEGDVTSEWVRELGLGCVVPPFDEAAIAAALGDMLSRPKSAWAPAFAPLAERFSWQRVVEPLRHYCLAGQSAPDRAPRRVEQPVQRTGLRQALYLWSTEGFGTMLSRGLRYLRLRLSGY
ncbi:MAG: glycosyltransferase [Anaerolineales bacterium]|nr:glycosyltransferase [Anaerolineales bacterium]